MVHNLAVHRSTLVGQQVPAERLIIVFNETSFKTSSSQQVPPSPHRQIALHHRLEIPKHVGQVKAQETPSYPEKRFRCSTSRSHQGSRSPRRRCGNQKGSWAWRKWPACSGYPAERSQYLASRRAQWLHPASPRMAQQGFLEKGGQQRRQMETERKGDQRWAARLKRRSMLVPIFLS